MLLEWTERSADSTAGGTLWRRRGGRRRERGGGSYLKMRGLNLINP